MTLALETSIYMDGGHMKSCSIESGFADWCPRTPVQLGAPLCLSPPPAPRKAAMFLKPQAQLNRRGRPSVYRRLFQDEGSHARPKEAASSPEILRCCGFVPSLPEFNIGVLVTAPPARQCGACSSQDSSLASVTIQAPGASDISAQSESSQFPLQPLSVVEQMAC